MTKNNKVTKIKEASNFCNTNLCIPVIHSPDDNFFRFRGF